MKDKDYHIDYNEPEKAAITTINMHRDTLVSFRNVTPNVDELEWEIRLYDFLLEDPVKRLKEYNDVRYADIRKGILLDKRQVIKKLGWDVK